MYCKKYIIVRICLVRMYGLSTGRAPIHANRITVFVIIQNGCYIDWVLLCSSEL
jgi:hypothetical protein